MSPALHRQAAAWTMTLHYYEDEAVCRRRPAGQVYAGQRSDSSRRTWRRKKRRTKIKKQRTSFSSFRPWFGMCRSAGNGVNNVFYILIAFIWLM